MLVTPHGRSALAVLFLTVLGACAPAGQVEDTPAARNRIAREIVKLEVQNGDLDQRLDRGAELAQAYSLDTLRLDLGRELTDEELTRVKSIMRSVLGEFITAEVWEGVLTEIYAAHFTAPELQATLDFFESPAGSKILRLSPQLTREIDDKTEEIFEPHLNEFTERVDAELAASFPGLREGGS